MDSINKKVCVIGLGYIGLPTASLLGTKGFEVLGVDTKQEVVDTINQGKIHIVEPDLDILVKSAVNSGNLSASTTPEPAEVFIIAVPTPFKDGKKPNLDYVAKATQSICQSLKPNDLVILESTSPVGTTTEVVSRIISENTDLQVGKDIFVAHCPERVLPGRILIELVENDRVIGGVTKNCTSKAVEFYKSFVKGKVLETSAKTAELVKLTENSFRDVNIAFANELSMICDQEQINVWELIQLANRHPRVNILQPGPGVGGHCIAVDPWFIVDTAPDFSNLIKTAREVNDSKPEWVIGRVKEKAERFKNPTIACLGLAFKADVDDLRESPAQYIAERLYKEIEGTVLFSEPNISTHPKLELTNYQDAIAQADIVLLLVDHAQFKEVSQSELSEKVVIDTRGQWM